ncbi:MAG: radical SAM protein [Oligoflexia bacterium]|nr:radical SAM protein [Oligoflexia bacterium]
MESVTEKKKFRCVAPWVESVLYNDGSFRICSRNHRSFGDWRQTALSNLWTSEELQEFRKTILEGEFPDQDCSACAAAGSSQTFRRTIYPPYLNMVRKLWEKKIIDDQATKTLESIELLFSNWNLGVYNKILSTVQSISHPSASKLEKALKIVKDYHLGEVKPDVVGAFRQVQLVAKCNARCVMCPGKFTGEIVNGGAITEDNIALALDHSKDVLDFFCNGSEFLLYSGWRQVADILKKDGCESLRISTNGMLLNETNVRYLIDHNVVGHLNISLNAGTPETLEKIQKNVRYDRLEKNIEFLFKYASEKDNYFPVSFSFIILRSNLHELPLFIDLIHKFRQMGTKLHPHALVMSLENAGLSDYRTFLFEEHPEFVPEKERIEIFKTTKEKAQNLGVEIELYNFADARSLDDLVEKGIPLFSPVSVDKESIDAVARAYLDPVWNQFFEEIKIKINEKHNFIAFPVGNIFKECKLIVESKVNDLEKKLRLALREAEFKTFRYLFDKVPEYKKIYYDYGETYVKALITRWSDQTGLYQKEIFKEKLQLDRENLRDHVGEKVYSVHPSKILPGARVLCKDQKQYRFWDYRKMLTLECIETGEARQYHLEFLEGVFLFDPVPGPRKKEDSSWIGRSLSKDDSIQPGSQIIFWNEDSWIFLHRTKNIVYLSPKNSNQLNIFSDRILEEAFLWSETDLTREKAFIRKKALSHARINNLKNFLLRNKKSKLLWKLSGMYRTYLAKRGISIPEGLVITTESREQKRENFN